MRSIMTIQDLEERLKEKKYVVSVVGGGGKSTLIEWLASRLTEAGRKVLVTTTTHIYIPEPCFYAADRKSVTERWAEGRYAVIGQPEPQTGKLTIPPQRLLSECMAQADTVLIEADGAKGMLCKVPADHEPVILPESDLVIGVVGMSCLGKQLRDCCFRWESVSLRGDECMTEEMLAELLSSRCGARKGAGARSYLVVLNQCDTELLAASADRIKALLRERGVSEVISVSLKRELEKRIGKENLNRKGRN